jgi:two-component system, LuxR family, response regulator FixJ
MSELVGGDREVFVLDDDAGVCAALKVILSNSGYIVTGVSDGASFLALARACTPACILLDVYLPGRSGLDILKELIAEDYASPILMMSGQGNIQMAVEAVQHGALDFIEKPFRSDIVLRRVRDAIESWERRRNTAPKLPSHFPERDLLTPREIEVLDHMAIGMSSKEIARLLGISFRTIEAHRASMMLKLRAKNSVDLMRIILS